MTNTNGTASYL